MVGVEDSDVTSMLKTKKKKKYTQNSSKLNPLQATVI